MDVESRSEVQDERDEWGDSQAASDRYRNYLQGVGLLLIVVLLWTSSNFITQDLFEAGFDKPFLVTYLNTSAFSIYLLPWVIRWSRQRWSRFSDVLAPREYMPLVTSDPPEASTAALLSAVHAPPIVPEEPMDMEEVQHLTTQETAKLASVFCLFWFIANWGLNAGLEFTSVASATVLSSTSGFFTLLLGRLFHVESMTIMKVFAVIVSFLGVALVSWSDSTTSTSETPQSTDSGNWHTESTLGDGLALLSALFYALYVILLKVRIKEESRIDMQLFFGFVGIFNVVMLWPFVIILHFTGAETLALPPTKGAWLAVLINMAITWSSDYIYVIAMLKTTPLLVTIGLGLTIPMAIVGDWVLHQPVAPLSIAGAVLVLAAFILIGLEGSKTEIGFTKDPAPNVDEAEGERD